MYKFFLKYDKQQETKPQSSPVWFMHKPACVATGQFPAVLLYQPARRYFLSGKSNHEIRRRFESNKAEVIQVGTTQWRRSASVSRSWVCDGFKGGAPLLPWFFSPTVSHFLLLGCSAHSGRKPLHCQIGVC